MSLVGLDCKLYRLTTGTRATWGTADGDGIHQGSAPSNLDEVKVVRDVTLNLEKGEADTSSRGSTWRTRKGTLKDGGVEAEMVWDPADTHFAAFLAAWLGNSTVACAVLDGDKGVNGVEGLWADFEVLNLTRNEPLEDAVTATVQLAPARATVVPEWVRVTGGSGSGT